MIKKPENYETINISSERMREGGHKCVIKQVEEQVSSRGNQMLVVRFDTALEDDQPDFYLNRWNNDTRDEKKWGGNMYIVLAGEYGEANLKRFITAVEDSNAGFEAWTNNVLALDKFKNQKVGIVFRSEDYNDPLDGTVRNSVKAFRFCNYEKAFEQKVPARKVQTATVTPQVTPNFGFVDVAVDDEQGLPFK